jgi:hypothetical protein
VCHGSIWFGQFYGDNIPHTKYQGEDHFGGETYLAWLMSIGVFPNETLVVALQF